MIFEAEQSFELTYPGAADEALAFLRDPARSLARVRFLRHLTVRADVVGAELLVQVPMLGSLALPFESVIAETPAGARLSARPLSGRAWAEVDGVGTVHGTALRYDFVFRVHLEMPDAEKWGGAAFEKMFHATARRTLERLARDFPDDIRDAMP